MQPVLCDKCSAAAAVTVVKDAGEETFAATKADSFKDGHNEGGHVGCILRLWLFR